MRTATAYTSIRLAALLLALSAVTAHAQNPPTRTGAPAPRDGKSAPPARLQITATFQGGAITGLIDDRLITVPTATLQIPLSAVRHIEHQKANAVLTLVDGTHMTLRLVGLDKVACDLDGQTITLNLREATAVDVKLAQDDPAVASLAHMKPVAPPPITAPDFQGAQQRIRLPAAVTQLAVGGGGRYLVLHLIRLSQFVLFDVSRAAVVKSMRVDDPAVRFAAGAQVLMVALPAEHRIERWRLATLERQADAELPVRDVTHMVMGASSAGPLFLNGSTFVDVETLSRIDVQWVPRPPQMIDRTQIHASADGLAFGMCPTGAYDAQLLTVVGRRVLMHGGTSQCRYIRLGADGSVLFTALGLYTPAFTHPGQPPSPQKHVLPIGGHAYMLSYKVKPRLGTGPVQWQTSIVGQDGATLVMPLADMPDLQHNESVPTGLPPEDRIHIIPEASVIVTLPSLFTYSVALNCHESQCF